MTLRDYRYALLTLVLGFLVLSASGRSWDLAVVIGHEIDFLAKNTTLTGQAQIARAVTLEGVAYDDSTRTMFLSDPRNSNVSIFSNDLTLKNFTSRPLLKRQNNSYISGMVFDPKTRTLFWSDTVKQTIMKMHVPLNRPPEDPVLLHNLTGKIPRGIALDVCNSHVYWVNSNKSDPGVERSNLDGSDRITIIKEGLYVPLAVAIDHIEQKLYWINDVEGIYIKIERSNLDGTQRDLVVRTKHQEPLYLAVDNDSVYWSDSVYRAIWVMPKNLVPGVVPTIFKSYSNTTQDTDPVGIITRDNVGNVDCEAIAEIRQRTNSNPAPADALVETYNNLTTSTEESELTTENSRYCLNGGRLDNKDGTCRCKLGFSGARCETSFCHNYCLRGSCHINSRGLAKCECPNGFAGERCERDACDGYCLHDGQCSVQNGKPTCKCKYFKGSRCEDLADITEICTILCASDQPAPPSLNPNLCRCPEVNETSAKVATFSENEYGTLLPIFCALIAVLVLLIAVLSCYVNKLRRRPRIKKRFVVSKGGVTPLTSRPQIPDNQCEITIENCCNMNICETPCFEPNLRTPGPRNNGTKKEEKNSLLDNMEGNSC